MRELHFYIQGVLILIALGVAVQVPHERQLLGVLFLIQFFLGLYQYGMSWFLMVNLKRKKRPLYYYFFGVKVYLLTMISLGIAQFEWLNNEVWGYILTVPAWAFAVFFVVVMEDLLRLKPKTI